MHILYSGTKIPILCPFQCISQSHLRIFHFSLVVELSMTLWDVLYLSNNVTYESMTWLQYIQTLGVNLNLQDHLKEGHGGEFCFHILLLLHQKITKSASCRKWYDLHSGYVSIWAARWVLWEWPSQCFRTYQPESFSIFQIISRRPGEERHMGCQVMH